MQELCNLLVVDWSNTVSHTYTQVTILLAALNTVLIGALTTAKFHSDWLSHIPDIHIIGPSRMLYCPQTLFTA